MSPNASSVSRNSSEGVTKDFDIDRTSDDHRDRTNTTAIATTKPGSQKPAAKSFVTLDVKPWDDTTNMRDLEASVRSIEKEGLVWGASNLVAVGFGVQKLRINLVVEDERVSVTDLQEQIEELEEYVQSSDVVGMQKI